MQKVLFVCIENSCRSQMAEGFARKLGEHILMPYSAGSRPSGKVHETAIEVMKEVGIDISQHQSKGFDALPKKDFDFVVTMGCGDACPVVAAKAHLDWKIEDPRGKDAAFFRNTREEIKGNIETLIRDILSKKSGAL